MSIMKRVVYLSAMAACAGAASLRGEEEHSGVEEVGEQIENFPDADYGYMIDRRILSVEEMDAEREEGEDAMAGRLMEEYFNEEEQEAFDSSGYVLEEFEEVDEQPDADVIGQLIDITDEEEEFEVYWGEEDEPTELKEHSLDADSHEYEGNSLLGEGEDVVYDLHDRRDSSCSDNKSEVKVILKTDNYAFETSWKLINNDGNKVIASGPPPNSNYADGRIYSGRWCLPPGVYRVQVNDKGRDGMCTGNPNVYGCGYVKVFLNGQQNGQVVGDKTRWQVKNLQVNAAPISSRIDGVGNGNTNNGGWCKKVRSVMKVPVGTCTLPNGQRGHRVRFNLKVDKFGKETSMKITRNGVVKMKMGNIVPSNDARTVEDCLPAGNYKLTVTDMDGVCCRHGEGHFKMMVDGTTLIGGGSFTKAISHDFKLGFDWIGSMDERDCEWWWAHDYRRRDWHTRCYSGQYCGKTYRHLKWNPNLKADAKVYANKLLDTCDTNGIKHDATEQGENLAKNKGSGPWGQLYPADKVTKRFVDNEEFWGWNGNAHLTQAMWYPTRYIGCAEAVKNMGGNKMCRMQVCRYAKAGNCMMGKYNSEVGRNWMKPMMQDDSPCAPMCPPGGGCHR